jgi:Protein of unknown function (DUF 659)
MANEISTILENIGINKFAAVVTDSGSNLRVARGLINEMYPHILNIRCAVHASNLIALDVCEINSIKPIISNCSMILNFFKSSHIANGYYHQQLKAMNIKGAELKSYTKTKCGSFYMTLNSIIKSRPVFDWVRNLYN